MRKSPRQKRLESDFQGVCQLLSESSIFTFSATGEPPVKYRLIFNGKGLYQDRRGQIKVTHQHECLIEFGAAYPRLVPNLAWQTPIYHPNISNNGVVCLGGYGTHWAPSLTLAELCGMLWDMIRYKNYDVDSPYNREAAVWARQQRAGTFPVDARNLRDKIAHPVGLNDDHGVEIVEAEIEVVDTRPKSASLEEDGIVFLD